MLDKFGLKLLNILLSTSENSEYVVISFEEIKSKFTKKEINDTILENTINYLNNNGYIKIKYIDEIEMCYAVLSKARQESENFLIEKKSKKSAGKLMVLNIILSCISAFVGAFMAILIVHFFL